MRNPCNFANLANLEYYCSDSVAVGFTILAPPSVIRRVVHTASCSSFHGLPMQLPSEKGIAIEKVWTNCLHSCNAVIHKATRKSVIAEETAH